MPRILLVTNDFPPTVGGIQSYLRDFLGCLDPTEVVVFASTQDPEAAQVHDLGLPYQVVRWPRKVMLPTRGTAREMSRIIVEENIDTVWFGAAAPLALMANAARAAGARHIIASTHGHEVGWSMLPGARHMLRKIGNSVDIVTYISEYTLRRFRRAFGTHPQFSHLPSGVDTELFVPADSEQRRDTRDRLGLGQGPMVVCISRLVPRKGQDSLIRAMPELLRRHPDLQLIIVGQGSYGRRLRRITKKFHMKSSVIFTGAVPFADLRAILASADVFAMPARTRGKGLDVEGLGIVYLEAQSSEVPVIAGDSGGAPETVTSDTGIVVNGRDLSALTAAVDRLIADKDLRKKMGKAGRAHVVSQWTWQLMGERLNALITPR